MSILKPYHGDQEEPSRGDSSHAPSGLIRSFDKKIEEILANRIVRRIGVPPSIQYLIKWKGLPIAETNRRTPNLSSLCTPRRTLPARAILLSAIPLPTRNPPLSFFSLFSTLSPSSSLWLTSLTAGLAVDPSLSGFTLLSRPFQTQARRALSPLQARLFASAVNASFVMSWNWEDEIELDGEVIELSYRGSYPWWQLLRGSVERSSARASLLYLPLFLVFTTMAFILFAEENVDIAVVEAGLGGARDATNVISSAAPHTPLRLRDDPERGSILEKLTEENLQDWGLLQDFYRFVKIVGAENSVLMSAAEQIFSAGGKRMRPALVFLVSRATAELLGLKEISRVLVLKDFEFGGPKWFVMVVDAEAYTYDDKVIKKAEVMGKPENPEEEATVETTRAIKHHQES
ncbi:Solanesyl diphosphate synthase 2 [Arachis hypogaea]|nr:Solanesyl diphosphate synthase 2 [Arachis hypogaea]